MAKGGKKKGGDDGESGPSLAAMGMAGTRRATAVALLSLATCARAYLLTPSRRTARCVPLRMQDAPPTWEPPSVPLQHVQPSPSLTPRDVVNSVMAALHRTNWDTPTPFYGFEVALRFLAPTHMAKVNNAKPGGYSRYMRQPHKVGMILWNEFRFEGDTILLENGDAPDEAYQMCSVRSSPTEEWTAARWKLVKVQMDFGESSFSQWMVDAVFANEPDQYNDQPLKLLSDPAPPPPPPPAAAQAKEVTSLEESWGNADAFAEQVNLADAWGAGADAWANQWDVVPEESPRQVVAKVMAALHPHPNPNPNTHPDPNPHPNPL